MSFRMLSGESLLKTKRGKNRERVKREAEGVELLEDVGELIG